MTDRVPATTEDDVPERVETRAGFVAILGLPNAGKSTLLNRILDEKVSITSPKPQTTRRRIAGILTRDALQVVFVDTPGLLQPAYALQRALAAEIAKSLEGVDLVFLVREPRPAAVGAERRVKEGAGLALEERAALAGTHGVPVFLVLNKADLLAEGDAARVLERTGAEWDFVERHVVSAATGAGLDALVQAAARRLPAAGFYFGADELTDRSMRFLAAEFVRESLFEELEQELPYASHAEVTSYDESSSIPRIEATIYVERDSQKGIVIGRGGETLKRIGTASRAKIEGLAGGQVFLHLTVKVRRDWRKRDVELQRFGYRG